jgi:hypothetical protein
MLGELGGNLVHSPTLPNPAHTVEIAPYRKLSSPNHYQCGQVELQASSSRRHDTTVTSSHV